MKVEADVLMDIRTQIQRHAVLHRQYVERVVEKAPSVSLGAQAVFLGLVAALAQTGVVLGHRLLVGTVTPVSVRLHWYHIAFGMVSNLAVFGLWWAGSRVVLWRCPRGGLVERVATYVGCFLTVVTPLLAIEGLHLLGSTVLALGISVRLNPYWHRWRQPLLRRALIPLTLGSALIGVGSFGWVATSEWRGLASLPPARAGAPNVVLIVLDTVRADHLSLYGYPRATTPRLESLADRAIRFNAARAAAPWTLPSHAAMFTGRLPHELPLDVDRPIGTSAPTLAGFLGEQGYVSGGFVGNTFYCNAWFGLDRGFTHYEDAQENREISPTQVVRSSELGQRMLPWLDRAGLIEGAPARPRTKTAAELNAAAMSWVDGRGDRPFFLFLNYFDAHDPYTVPAGYPLKYSRLKRSDVFNVNLRAFRALWPNQGASVPESEKREAGALLSQVGVDAYDDCIRYLDDQIAGLFEDLERRNLAENTWVVITSDHGEHFGEHGIFWHGSSLYREVLDVPLLVFPPRSQASQTREVPRQVDAPVSLCDLPATVADVLGLASQSPFPGRSLRGHWDRAAAAPELNAPKVSELKLSKLISTATGFEAAVVANGLVYHRSATGAEKLFAATDRRESVDLAPNPVSGALLDAFRRFTTRLLRNVQ